MQQSRFAYQNYIDIFDGGPTMFAQTDQIKTIREARDVSVSAIVEGTGEASHLVSCGKLANFRACLGQVDPAGDGVTLDAQAAGLLGVAIGDTITCAPA